MSDALTARSRVFALLGDPVAHSLSPRFQNAALRSLGLDAAYVALRCATAELPGLLRGLALAGGGGNVTIPHKALAARVVDRATAAVERTGACNTFWADADGVVRGDNTDVAGVGAAVRLVLGGPAAGARVLLVGAGGAASAALAALLDEGAEVVVVNRTESRARELVERVGAGGGPARASATGTVPAGAFDLAVNATSLGLQDGDRLPLAPEVAVGAGLDLVYTRSGATPWVRQLRARGIRAADGTEMLLHQGAAAFERWWARPAPIAAMRAALEPGP